MTFGRVFDLSVWGYIGVALLLTHVTIASVTIFLHRHQAHRALTLHPIVSHFFRFWLWLTTGMVTREWVAVHRKHHAKCETEADPHSPQIWGIWRVLFGGVGLYRKASTDAETLDVYGRGTPDDWIERNLYSRYTVLGLGLDGRHRRRAVRLARASRSTSRSSSGSRSGPPASSTASATTWATATSRLKTRRATSSRSAC